MTQGLEAIEPDGLPRVTPPRPFMPPQSGCPTGLLIADEDCRVEDFNLAALGSRTTATLAASSLRSPLPLSDLVTWFEAGALADAAMRVGASPVVLHVADPTSLVK